MAWVNNPVIIPLEASEHALIVKYIKIQYPLARIHHSPLEGKRTKKAQGDLKRNGATAGFPDLLIFDWLTPKILFMEIKRIKGSKVSDEQKEWNLFLSSMGYYAVIVKGFDAAKEEIDKFFSR